MSLRTYLERSDSRRGARYLRRRELLSAKFPRLRNQRARRGLIVAILLTLSFMILAGIALALTLVGSLPAPWSLAWLFGSGVLVVLWTLLSISVDAIDSAPLSVLDEYQRAQIESLRSFVYRCFLFLGLILLVVLLFLGSYIQAQQPSWSYQVPYFTGVVMFFPFMLLTMLPTMVIAWNQPDEDGF